MKTDLSKATFIIPVRIESDDRLRNVITSLCFLLENFETNIILKEVDSTSVFRNQALPQISEFLGKVPDIDHIFEESDGGTFHRQRILNEMLWVSNTEVVVNYDCDVVLPLDSYLKAYNFILDHTHDVVYPYGQGMYQKQVAATDELVSDFLSNDFDFSVLDKNSNIHTSDFGWAQFFNRNVYIEGGMENENFVAYAPEDKERFYRFTKLGYNVGRINDYVYHLEHKRGPNSWFSNPHMNQNNNEWEKVQSMSMEKLKNYYLQQSYLKKYQ